MHSQNKTLFEAIRKLHEQNSFQSILSYVCRLTKEFSGAEQAIIIFKQKRINGFQVPPILLIDSDNFDFDFDILLPQGANWEQVILVDDTEKDVSWLSERLRGFGVKSCFLATLTDAEKILPQIDKMYHNVVWVGLCLICKQKSNIFSQDMLLILNAIVHQTIVALAVLAYQKRSQQLDLLLDETIDAISLLGTDYLIKEIIQQAVILLDAKRGGFHKYDGKTSTLEFVAGYKRNSHQMKVGEGIAGHLVESGKDFIIVDNYYESDWKHTIYNFEERDCPSVLKVVLRSGNRIIGVLYVDSDLDRKFSERDALILLRLGDYIVTEIIRAEIASNKSTNSVFAIGGMEEQFHLYSEVQAFTRVIRRIVEQRKDMRHLASSVTQNRVLTDNLPKTLTQIVDFTKRLTECDAVTLYVRDISTSLLVNPPIHTEVKFQEKIKKSGTIPPHSKLYEVANKDNLYIVDKLSLDKLFGEVQFTVDEGIKSYVAAPLHIPQVGNVGVMFVHYRTPRLFSDDEKDTIRFLAAQAAAVVRVSQTLNVYQDRTQILAKLNEVGKQVTGIAEVNDILRQIIEGAAELTDQSTNRVTGVIHEIKKVGESYQVKSIPYPPSSEQVAPRLPPDDKGVTWEVITSGNYKSYSNITENTIEVNPEVRRKNIRAMIAMPIKLETEVMGVFFLNYFYPRSFDEFIISVLEQLAGYAAIAIRNAHQLDYERRSNRVLKSLSYATEAITNAGLTEDQRLRRILDGALSMIDNPNQCVADVYLLNLQNPNLLELRLSQSIPVELLGQSDNDINSIDLQPYIGKDINDLGDAKIGIVGLTILSGEPQLVNKNLRNHPNYRNQYNTTKSQLSVPLIVDTILSNNEKVIRKTIGVLTLEHSEENAFTDEIVEGLCTLGRVAAGTIRDSRQHKELLDIEARQKQFLLAVQHQLRIPLFEKDWNIDYLLDDITLSPDHRDTIKAIDQLIELEKFLVNNLLDFGRIQQGEIKTFCTNVSLVEIIFNAITFIKSTSTYAENPVSININFPSSDPLIVFVDDKMISQIIVNLLHNAVKFTHKNGNIFIIVTKQISAIRVIIKDNGIGIPDDILSQIANEKYNSLSTMRRPTRSGMRIGLSIVDMFLNAHKSKLNVESKEKVGTTFWFDIASFY